MASVKAYRRKFVNNRLEPDYRNCAVCGFPCFNRYTRCPNCGSIFYKSDPMDPDGMITHAGALKNYKNK